MAQKVDISYKTIIFSVVVLIFLWVLYTIREIILQFFLALLITAILNPLVTKLSKRKIPRAASVLVVYLILFALISISVAAIIPPLVQQTADFITKFPVFVNRLGLSQVVNDKLVEQLVLQLGRLPAQVASLFISALSNIVGLVAVLVFAFYLLSERDKLDDQLSILIGRDKEHALEAKMAQIETKLGSWARGQITLMFVVGLSNYIGFTLIGIPFSLPLAILAGLMEVVPYIGPVIAAIPAVLIGFGLSPILGFATAALVFLVQQLENYLFVPKILQKSTGVHPIITLLALAIGFKLAGIIGVLVAVPVFITLEVLIQDRLHKDLS